MFNVTLSDRNKLQLATWYNQVISCYCDNFLSLHFKCVPIYADIYDAHAETNNPRWLLLQNGTYGCSSLCPQEHISPRGNCQHPRLVEVPGQCCREWMCDSQTGMWTNIIMIYISCLLNDHTCCSLSHKKKTLFPPCWSCSTAHFSIL